MSIVFVDLVGSTAAAERLDPEDVRALLAPITHACGRSSSDTAGTVEKFIGDAVVAVFGAPVVHEDDAERAVRAALAIRDGAREADASCMRIAVNTGEALVTLGARPAEGEGMVAGDVVNTAARLQSAAPVNGILVGETTYRATSHVIDYREAEPVDGEGQGGARRRLGGGRRPVALRRRRRAGAARAARRPRAGGRCCCATRSRVRGGSARRSSSRWSAFRGSARAGWSPSCSQIVEATPELITLAPGPLPALRRRRQLLGARRDDEGAGRHPRERLGRRGGTKLTDAVASSSPIPTEARGSIGHLRPLAGLGRTPVRAARPRGEAFAAWRRFLEALAEQRPHGARVRGPALGGRRAARLRRRPRRRATRRAAARRLHARGPSSSTRRPGWGGGKPNALTLSLSTALRRGHGAPDRRALSQAVLPAETQQTLLARAERQPALRRGVRPDAADRGCSAGTARRGGSTRRARRAGDGAGDHRRPPRRARRRGEGAAAGRLGGREGVLAGLGRSDRRHRALGRRGAAARARAQGARAPRAPGVGGRRDRVRLPARARARRRLRADPASPPRRPAPPGGRSGSRRSAEDGPRIAPRCWPTTT